MKERVPAGNGESAHTDHSVRPQDVAPSGSFTSTPNEFIELDGIPLDLRGLFTLLLRPAFDRGRGNLRAPSYQSQATLARRAGCSVATIVRKIKHLEKLGLVRTISGRGRKTSNYVLMATPNGTPLNRDRSDPAALRGQTQRPRGVSPANSDGRIIQKKEQKKTTTLSDAAVHPNRDSEEAAVKALVAFGVDQTVAIDLFRTAGSDLILGWTQSEKVRMAETPAAYLVKVVRQKLSPPIASANGKPSSSAPAKREEWLSLSDEERETLRAYYRCDVPREKWEPRFQNLKPETLAEAAESVARERAYRQERQARGWSS